MRGGSGMGGQEASVHVNLLFTLSREMGVLQEGHRGMMALMERTRIEMHERADRIEQRLWQIERPPPTPSPPTASRTRDPLESLGVLLQHLATLIKLTLPLAALALMIAYKGAHPDWLPILRELIGLR